MRFTAHHEGMLRLAHEGREFFIAVEYNAAHLAHMLTCANYSLTGERFGDHRDFSIADQVISTKNGLRGVVISIDREWNVIQVQLKDSCYRVSVRPEDWEWFDISKELTDKGSE